MQLSTVKSTVGSPVQWLDQRYDDNEKENKL